MPVNGTVIKGNDGQTSQQATGFFYDAETGKAVSSTVINVSSYINERFQTLRTNDVIIIDGEAPVNEEWVIASMGNPGSGRTNETCTELNVTNAGNTGLSGTVPTSGSSSNTTVTFVNIDSSAKIV